MKALLATLVCLASAEAAHAQLRMSLGPLVGTSLATTHSSGNPATYGYRVGLLAGAQAEMRWGRFSVQPALAFSQLGSTYTVTYHALDPNDPSLPSSTVAGRQRLNYLTLPLPVAFNLTNRASGPQVFAGPYVSVLLGGRVESGSSSTAIYVADQADLYTAPGPTARRLDAGLQAGLGFRVKGLLLRASYSLGLRSFESDYTYRGAPVSFDLTTSYNRSFQASASYLFALKQ